MVPTDADCESESKVQSAGNVLSMCNELFGSPNISPSISPRKPVANKVKENITNVSSCISCGRTTNEYCNICNLPVCNQHSYHIPAPCCFTCYKPEMMQNKFPQEECVLVHELILNEPDVQEETFEYQEVPNHCDDTVVLPCIYNSRFILLMTVRGHVKRGLIIDPGAAKGVIGSDTLRGIQDDILSVWHLKRSVVWQPSQSRFSGISATQEMSLGLCGIPIGLQGVPKSMFYADVLGGSASMCPGLVPLHSLMSNTEFMHFAFFENGDGILGVKHNGKIEPQRLYLTDSGHYLLRIDMFNVPSDYRLNQVIANRLSNQLLNTRISQSSSPQRSARRNRESVDLPVFCDDEVPQEVFQ